MMYPTMMSSRRQPLPSAIVDIYESNIANTCRTICLFHEVISSIGHSFPPKPWNPPIQTVYTKNDPPKADDGNIQGSNLTW